MVTQRAFLITSAGVMTASARWHLRVVRTRQNAFRRGRVWPHWQNGHSGRHVVHAIPSRGGPTRRDVASSGPHQRACSRG